MAKQKQPWEMSDEEIKAEIKKQPQKIGKPKNMKEPWEMTDEEILFNTPQAEVSPNSPIDDAKDLGLLYGKGLSLDTLDEIAGGVNSLAGEDYTESRNKMRKEMQAAKIRQGTRGTVAEVAGGITNSFVMPGGGMTKGPALAREVGLSLVQGAGAADEMEDIPKEALISGGTSLATNAVTSVISKGVEAPLDIMARTGGARGIDFRKADVIGEYGVEAVDRLNDPAGLAARLDKMDFWSRGEKVFDQSSGKFIKDPKIGKLESFFTPPSLEVYAKRSQDAIEKLAQENDKLIGNKVMPVQDLIARLNKLTMEFAPDGAGVEARQEVAEALTEEIINDLTKRGAIKNGKIAVKQVEQAKRYLQQKVKKSYENQTLHDITNDQIEAHRRFATGIDDLVDGYGGRTYKENNDKMRDLFVQQKLLNNKISRQRGYGVEGPALTRPDLSPGTLIQQAADNPSFGIMRAKTGQALGEKGVEMIQRGASRAAPVIVNPGRSPQSVPNLAEELIRTPLPRTTDGLLKNKNFVLSKVAQMAPEMLEAVQDTYDHEPEMLSEIAPVLAQKMPHFFEKDKYNRFDGRIMTEADKQKAIKDTLGDPNLSSIEQAKIITRLNKEGLYDR